MLYKNRDVKRGGGVGVYIKDNIPYKVRNDITNLDKDLELLWLEVNGKKKHSKLLVCVMYQPNFSDQDRYNWIDKFDKVLNNALLNWEGNILLTGDTNIDLVKDKYIETLTSYNLVQHVRYPTPKSCSLIDHIITNEQCKTKCCDVIPTPEISDHDAVICMP